MTQGLRELTSQELNVALESVLLPRFAAVLGKREAGHCMRVTDLDRDLMVRLCGGLRSLVPADLPPASKRSYAVTIGFC